MFFNGLPVQACFLVTSGRPLAFFDRWRSDLIMAEAAMADFCQDIGAFMTYAMRHEKPTAWCFPGNVAPEGWLAPDAAGKTRPRRDNRDMWKRIDALPWPEHPERFLVEELGLPHLGGHPDILPLEYGRFYQPMMAEKRNPNCPVVILAPSIGAFKVPDGLERIPMEEAGRLLRPEPVDFDKLSETLSAMNGL